MPAELRACPCDIVSTMRLQHHAWDESWFRQMHKGGDAYTPHGLQEDHQVSSLLVIRDFKLCGDLHGSCVACFDRES